MSSTHSSQNPSSIDWTIWSPPEKGDVRSPCPVINALANHGLLPHDGRGITKRRAVEALTSGTHLDANIASIFTSGALATNPDHTAHTFDLHTVGVHGAIEHDVSLSREDVAFGSNLDFSKDIFAVVLRDYSSQGDPEEEGETESSATTETTTTTSMTNWRSASRVRYARVMASKAKHEQHDKTWTYGLREAVMSYGETALLLSLLGKDGVAPIDWIRILFEEERFPYHEGWRPPEVINQSMLNHGYYEMIEAHEHRTEEAKLVGLGTFEALKTSILSLGASLVKMPRLFHQSDAKA